MPKSRPQTARSRPGSRAISAKLLKALTNRTRSRQFTEYLARVLQELCAVDTTPRSEPRLMQAAESRCFEILERELASCGFPGARTERRPINPAIQAHPSYSLLHFTRTTQRPEGLKPEEVYRERSNLVFVVPGTDQKRSGQSLALNAHLDVVAPYFLPRWQGKILFGRGACDDKGPLVGIVAALKVLSEVLTDQQLRLNRNVVGMFVVEEETGGNGSLSLVTDRELKAFYDSIMVCECTGLKLHPANRGAVWYKAILTPPAGVSALEMSAYVNEELEKEGLALRAESRHALFPQRPVQTCHGILGPFGEHPSRICGHVRFTVEIKSKASRGTELLLRDCLDFGLAGYLGLYGDKSKVIDPATGKPMVPVHYALHRSKSGYTVNVYGATGHMGAIRERDGAITKFSHLLRALIRSRARLEAAAGPIAFRLEGDSRERTLILEGGQGFVPTHTIDEVMRRLRTAAQRGAESHLAALGRNESGEHVVTVTYEKLHNVAFDGDPRSASARNATAAARACGLPSGEPLLGWTVSCDARLFATEYPGMEVLTFGPGQLAHAHSDQEQIVVDDIRKAAECLALFVLKQTGTI